MGLSGEEYLVSDSAVMKAVALVASWTILLIGTAGTVLALRNGSVEWQMIFLPIWVVITGMLTYAAIDDWRVRKARMG